MIYTEPYIRARATIIVISLRRKSNHTYKSQDQVAIIEMAAEEREKKTGRSFLLFCIIISFQKKFLS